MSREQDAAVSGIAAESRFDGSGCVPEGADEVKRAGPECLLASQATLLASKAAAARSAGNEAQAEDYYRAAISAALQALDATSRASPDLTLQTARWALEGGEATLARRLLNEQRAANFAGDPRWAQIAQPENWPDVWLVAAVRHDPTDDAALDALVQRYWSELFGRCQMLTAKRETAADLAQETWCRVLHGRERLRPGGNFRAYLFTIATNLWRDSQRAALRAGTMADHRVASLDHPATNAEGHSLTLAESLPDLEQMEASERDALKRDLDQAMERLDALSRDVLVARFLDGESCADIGRRYGRTEQTANGWVRRALSEMKRSLEELRPGRRSR